MLRSKQEKQIDSQVEIAQLKRAYAELKTKLQEPQQNRRRPEVAIDQLHQDLPNSRATVRRAQQQTDQARSNVPTPPFPSSTNRSSLGSGQPSSSPRSNGPPPHKRPRLAGSNLEAIDLTGQTQSVCSWHGRMEVLTDCLLQRTGRPGPATPEAAPQGPTPLPNEEAKDPNERPPIVRGNKGEPEHTREELFNAFDVFSETDINRRVPATQLDDQLKDELFTDGVELEKYRCACETSSLPHPRKADCCYRSKTGWQNLTAEIRQNIPKCASWRYFDCRRTSIKPGNERENHACRYCRKHGLLCIVKSTNDQKPLMMPLPAEARVNLSPNEAAYWRRPAAWNATKALGS